jgi:tetratricopeptide (TPR) repeat protein
VSPSGVLVAAGAALLAFSVLLLPWLGERWADDAAFASPARATVLAKRARSVDPLLVEPLWALALAEEQRGHDARALAYYEQATREQPQNAQTWLAAGRFALSVGCAHRALQHFYRFNALNKNARPSEGPDDYRRALVLVNSGKPNC